VKYAWDLELLVGSILVVIVSHVTLLALSIVFRCDSRSANPVLMTNSFFITMSS
jgi:hypothetical protein